VENTQICLSKDEPYRGAARPKPLLPQDRIYGSTLAAGQELFWPTSGPCGKVCSCKSKLTMIPGEVCEILSPAPSPGFSFPHQTRLSVNG